MSDMGLAQPEGNLRQLFDGTNSTVAMVSYGNDRGMIAEFFIEDRYQSFESTKEGRAIYKPIEMVRLRQAGNRYTDFITEVQMHDEPNKPSHPHRFPREWAAFKAQQEQVSDGTPLEMCKFITSHRVKELKAVGIHTAEKYAELPDSTIQNLGLGAPKEQAQCRAYLSTSDQDRAAQQAGALRAENERLANDLEIMKQQMAQLNQAMQDRMMNTGSIRMEPEVPHTRGPGRPRKE